MAGKGRIDADIIDESAFKRFQDLLEFVDKGIAKLDKFQKSTRDAFSTEDLDELSKAQRNYTTVLEKSANEELQQVAALKERARLLRSVETSTAKVATTNTKANQTIRENRIVQRQLNAEIDLNVKATNEQLGAYTNLRAQVQKLEKEFLDLAAANKLNTSRGQQVTRDLESQRKKFVEINQAAGNFRDNVGNYPSALSGAIGAVKNLAAAFGALEILQFAKDAVILANSARGVEFAFENLGQRGVDALEDVRESTRGLISDLELKQALIEFDNLNIELDKAGVAFEFLAVRAAQTGEPIEKLRGDLVTGLGRESAQILDNLGLDFNELKEIAEDTGGTIRDAFGVIAQREIAEAGGILDETTNSVDQLNASFKNFQLQIGQIVDSLRIVEGLAAVFESINGYFDETSINAEATNIRLRQSGKELVSFRATVARIRDTFRQWNEVTREEDRALVELDQRLKDTIGNLNDAAKAAEDYAKVIGPLTEEQIKENEALAGSIFDLGFSQEKKEETDKKGIQILERSVAFYRQQNAQLKELRDNTAQTVEEFQRYNTLIEENEKKISILENGTRELQETVENVLTNAGPVIDTDGIQAELGDIAQAKAEAEQRIERENVQAINAIRSGLLDGAVDLNEQQLEDLRIALEAQKNLQTQVQQEIGNTIRSGLSSIFDARVETIDAEIQANRDQLAQIQADETLSEEQKLDAKRAFAEQEAKLQEERRKRERQAFLVQQGLALAQVAIDLAKAISAINAIAATLPPVASQVYRATNIPRVVSVAALQTAAIAAQSFPAFFQGKSPLDNYEGPATVNELPGQREISVMPDGSVEILPSGAHLRYVKSKEIIVPSFKDFRREMTRPGGELFKRVHKRFQDDVQSSAAWDYEKFAKAVSKGVRKSGLTVNTTVNLTGRRRGYFGRSRR